jgi:hypothetical protein
VTVYQNDADTVISGSLSIRRWNNGQACMSVDTYRICGANWRPRSKAEAVVLTMATMQRKARRVYLPEDAEAPLCARMRVIAMQQS